MGKATLQKAVLGRITAGVTVREQAGLNMGCVSPLSKSPLCSEIPAVLLSPFPGLGHGKDLLLFPLQDC